ncbi:MAG TPA: hypothetical protein VFD84_15235 [Candidatus Binatia bacterium]|jgi:hypothetical protein|nr:hypothetical protein [Candidatus Binatia bacterium]
MTACLDDRALFRLHDGDGSAAERAHVDACDDCARRYRTLVDDVELLARVVRDGPPPLAARRPVLAGGAWLIPALAVAAAEVAVILWTRPAAPPPVRTASAAIDISRSLDEVSTALFAASDVPAGDDVAVRVSALDDGAADDDAWLDE